MKMLDLLFPYTIDIFYICRAFANYLGVLRTNALQWLLKSYLGTGGDFLFFLLIKF